MFRLGVSVDDPLLWLGLALQIVGYVLAGVLLVRLREKVTGRASAVGLWWRRLLGMLRRLLRIGVTCTPPPVPHLERVLSCEHGAE
jgi:hypothetical protein